MPPTTPLLLFDNVFDSVVLQPGALVTASNEMAGREAFRVADYRRERTWWQPTTDGGGVDHWVRSQLPAAQSVDYVVLDRGHNLYGKTLTLEGGPDGATWNVSQTLTVPAQGAVGGTPAAAAMAATEEGVAWTLFAPLASRLYWRLRIPYSASFIPVVTGLMVGLRTQLLGYSNIFDEDASERTEVSETSKAGYRATDTTYSWRTCELGLELIGSTEYDNTIRAVKTALFDRNAPVMVFMDYGTRPERGWLFQYAGNAWNAPKTRVYRSARIRLRECGQRLG
jgi:hypothetical protein